MDEAGRRIARLGYLDAAPLREENAASPEVRFFAQANPGHAEGDMLVCLFPLTAANWASVARRAFRRSRKAS